jgi:hypothetical protein
MFDQLEATVEAAVDSSLRPDEFAAFCRSAEARTCWPGVSNVSSMGGGIFYSMDMRVPGAPGAQVHIEEHLRASQQDDTGVSFEAAARFEWPTNEVASVSYDYRFVERQDGSRLHFSMRYVMPKRLGGELVNKARYASGVERAVQLFLEGAAQGGRWPEAVPTSAVDNQEQRP